MVIVGLFQVMFGSAAIVACFYASRAALRRDNARLGLYLFTAGALSLVFFLAIPHVRYELVLAALLVVFTGALLAPVSAPSRTTSIGDDSTLDRRHR
jgi:hypothetical protein